MVALASPREAVVSGPLGIYGATAAGRLVYAEATAPQRWHAAGEVPDGSYALAAVNGRLVAADREGLMWTASLSDVDRVWQDWGKAGSVSSLTAMNGRLYAIAEGDQIVSRLPSPTEHWRPIGAGAGATAIAASAVCWREVLPGTEDPA